MTTRLFNHDSIYSDTEVLRGSKFKLDGLTRNARDGSVYLESLGKVFRKAVDTWDTANGYTHNDEFIFHEEVENGNTNLILECLPAEYKQAVLKPVRKPTYTFSRISPTDANENSNLEVRIDTTDVPNGAMINYYFSGANITPMDFDSESLTGSTSVYNNVATISTTIRADYLTEGTEDLRLNLSTGEFMDFRILDTSLTTIIQISHSPINPAKGGGYITFDIAGAIPYTRYRIFRQENPDIYPVYSTLVDSSGAGSIQLYITINSPTYDFIFDFGWGQFRKTVTITTQTVPITYNITPTVSANKVYAVVNSTGLPYATDIPYTITGVTSSDINNGSLTGVISTEDNDRSEYSVNIINTLIGAPKTLTLTLDGRSTSIDIPITEFVPTFALTTSRVNNIVSEGQQINVTIKGGANYSGVAGSYTITGVSANDVNVPLTGIFSLDTNNTAVLPIFIIVQDSAESTETMRVTLNTGTFVDISILNSGPTYVLTSNAVGNAIDNYDTLEIYLATTLLANSTAIPYTITGVSYDNPPNSTSNELSEGEYKGVFTIYSNNSGHVWDLDLVNLPPGQTRVITLSLDGLNTSIALTINGN